MLPTMQGASKQQGYLAAVVIAKNEASYLKEWLEFHRLVGVEHVFFYDNDSSDDTLAILSQYLKAGFITCIPWKEFDRDAPVQFQAYAHALCNFGPAWRWMAFIDVDEFLFPLKENSLASVMSAYEDLPAVAVPWHMYGFSGHKHRPTGLVIESFTKRAPFPPPPHPTEGKTLSKWKCIANPRRIHGVTGAHLLILDDDTLGAYDETRRRISPGQTDGQVSNILRLNHYFTKSEEEFAHKLTRSDVSGKSDPVPRLKEMAGLIEFSNLVEDTEIQRFLPDLRRVLTK